MNRTGGPLTLVLRIGDEFADHGLDDAYVAIERAAQTATEQSHPKISGEAYDKQGGDGAKTSRNEYLFPAEFIAQSTPEPASALAGLGVGDVIGIALTCQ
jgi:hypothetical protein